ncbi:hypothetical protein HXY33_00345 [Candidatus Bathyarchaeota archaeon]|nr:hypothetical protein [Candidatus Bathyarchaeota archaeon]
MRKIATITICLLEGCIKKSNKALESEIYAALSEVPIKIPWMKNIEKVKVTEEQ